MISASLHNRCLLIIALISPMLLTACGADDNTRQPPSTEADIAAVERVLTRIEHTFSSGDLDAAMDVFTEDAVILGEDQAEIAGKPAIRAAYSAMLQQFDVFTEFRTEEIVPAGELAYERGSYLLRLTDKASGQIVNEAVSRHVHIFRRGEDGAWRTWRMMTNSGDASDEPE